MKGLILSGGKGTRLRPITYTSAKQLVPVANKPVLFYAIESLVEAGVTDIGIVVGDTREEIKAAVGDGSRWGARITYVEQPEPLGLAHAVKVAQGFLEEDPFIMYLGDNVIQGSLKGLVDFFCCGDLNCQILLKQVPDPHNFGVAVLSNGRVDHLVEKPKNPESDLALVGIYMFDRHIFEAVNSIKPSGRGELEITDAIQFLIDRGLSVHPHVVEGWWVDTGKMEDILEVNRLVLDTLESRIEGVVDANSTVDGKVILDKTAEVINSRLRGPIIIGPDARIVNSYIGPFTSIHYGVTITSSEIEHSIILENSRIIDIEGRIEDSLIGRNVEITKSPIKPKAYKMMLGDNSKVGIL
ncbi:MAG: glucose-1-phosphate thymidylyltransferase [Chloroflexi bacterium]|nr:glucose-1-phosphate thymidylyltransferase [Chloroflexota bacterium]